VTAVESRKSKPSFLFGLGQFKFNPASIGNTLIRIIINGGFAKNVPPVNPKYRMINGLTCFATISDIEQGGGINSNLLGKCLAIAEKLGFNTIYGIALHKNRNMLALGKKL
jgi:hypothetical protein